jgi:hypothetical protein
VAKWIDPNFSLLEALVANSMWRSRLKNLWRILWFCQEVGEIEASAFLIAGSARFTFI